MDFEINLTSKLGIQQLQNIAKKFGDWTQELIDSGIVLLRSIDKNYMAGGRPKWPKKSLAAQLRNGMTLIDTGRLRRSTQISISGTKPDMADEEGDTIYQLGKTQLKVGTAVPYYKYLHETWPAILVQDEDVQTIEKIFLRSVGANYGSN